MTFDMGARELYGTRPAAMVSLPRSTARLNDAAVYRARLAGRALAFDPMQSGWVPADVDDDLGHPSQGGPRNAITHEHPARRARPDAADPFALALGAYRLRPWGEHDAPRFAALLGDEAVWRHLPERYPGALGTSDAAGMIALAKRRDDHDVLAIEHAGVPIGQIRLEFEPDGTGAELSYWFGRPYWGSGHAGRVVPAFVGAVAERHPWLARLKARVHEDNAASAAVLMRAGFARTPEDDRAPWRFYGRGVRRG